MKTLNTETIIQPIAKGIVRALMNVDEDVADLLQCAAEKETSPAAKWALSALVKNAAIARDQNCFACQDTGLAVVFVELGQNLALTGRLLSDAVNDAVKLGYFEARKSVAHPLTRINTETNAPAVIYVEVVPGDKLKISFLAKGAGSENMSAVYMLTPSKGKDGIVNSVIECVKKAGANPCPPILLGIGIGGTMEKAALLSKKALLRPCKEKSPDPEIAALETEILEKVNALKIGAQGFGGDTTALSVAVEVFPTHIGMLPVAVNVQCHSVRHFTLEF